MVLAGCAMPRQAQGDVVLISQPPPTNAASVGLGFFSSSHARPTRNYKRGDDFSLARDSTITAMRWWGLSEGRIFDDLRNFTQYTLEVFEAQGAAAPLPGALLWSATLTPSQLQITPTGRRSPDSGASEYRYESILNQPLSLRGGRSYILAISARSSTISGDAWQWQDGQLNGGHGANYSYATRAWTPFQDTDSAFELVGTAVPSPGAALSLGAAASLACFSRRARGVRGQSTSPTRRG